MNKYDEGEWLFPRESSLLIDKIDHNIKWIEATLIT